MAWSLIYNIILTSPLQTRHRTIRWIFNIATLFSIQLELFFVVMINIVLLLNIHGRLTLPDLPDGYLKCAPYSSSGTSYSIYFIFWNYELGNTCCVRSSHESKICY